MCGILSKELNELAFFFDKNVPALMKQLMALAFVKASIKDHPQDIQVDLQSDQTFELEVIILQRSRVSFERMNLPSQVMQVENDH